jgi:hypothetical protein
VTYRKKPLERYDVPRSGVSYSYLLEMIFAARWRGLSDEQFEALSIDSQARTIAAYRVSHQIEAVLATEQARKSNQPPSHQPRRRAPHR